MATAQALAACAGPPDQITRALARIRGYERAEVEQEPEKAAPHAIADRDRQLAIMAGWLARWDRATGNANAPPPVTPSAAG